MRQLLVLAIVCSSARFTIASDDAASVADSMARVHFRHQENTLLLNVNETADAFNWKAKIVTPHKLVTVCREGETAICIPLRLDKIRWHEEQDQLFVEAATLEKALSFKVETVKNVVTLHRVEPPADSSDSDVPAYNAEWGSGRGFRVGQTLPDIPLYDLQGREVRLSRYLGKQLAIYVWASWCSCRYDLPEWQAYHEKLADEGFTVIGIALDSEGVAPAKLYYDKYAVTFPALVDPNYATGFEVAPHTFFVDEQGVVQPTKGWQERIRPAHELRPVTDAIRRQWSEPEDRLAPEAIARLAARHRADSKDLAAAVELASRYLDLNLTAEARDVLKTSVVHFQPLEVAAADSPEQTRLLSQAYFQLARANQESRDDQVRYATLSFYLKPSIAFGKQIARIISPDKFDGTPDGRFDDEFREGTLRRLKNERAEWLKGDRPSP